MTEESYDALDRATLTTWRVANTIGWSGAALAAALLLHTVGDQLSQRFGPLAGPMNSRPGGGFGGTWQFWAPKYGMRAGVAILAGLSIGLILGPKAWRRPVALATVVAAAYVSVTWLALETSITPPRFDPASGVSVSVLGPHHGLPANGQEWSYSVLGLFALAVAPLVAWLVARRKRT